MKKIITYLHIALHVRANMKRQILATCSLALLVSPSKLQSAQIVENSDLSDQHRLSELIVTAHQNPVNAAPLTVQHQIQREQIETMNVLNPENALQYAPNVFVRTRFPGDRNGVISIRGASPFQNARSLVYADGVLLSNLLENRFNGAPKWQIVAPQEIESINIIYGPYSAEHSGNAMNGVIDMKTRLPNEREATLQTTVYTQKYNDVGVSGNFGGFNTFASYGDKVGKLSIYSFFQRIESDSQPQTIAATTDLTNPVGAPTAVTGVYKDLDPYNKTRFIYGATGFGETEQDLGKIKLAYDVNEDMRIQATFAHWVTKDTRERADNFLRNGSGSSVWGGNAVFDGRRFSINPAQFNVESREREDVLFGLTTEGTAADHWNYEALFTYYGILQDERTQSSRNPRDPAYTTAGRIQDYDNTGWLAANFKLGREGWFNNESIDGFVGLHWDRYEFGVKEWNSTNYLSGLRNGPLRNDEAGTTSQYAAFGQWDYHPIDDWTFTAGARLESWEASQGMGFAGTKSFAHPSRNEQNISPKFSISYKPVKQWEHRLSLARAVRYPIVTELFQGDPDARAKVISNPSLEPEQVLAGTLMSEYFLKDGGSIQLAYFNHRENDTIFNQRALLTGGQTLSTFVNVDRVATQGLEFTATKRGILHSSLETMFNSSFNHARIRENRIDPTIEGNRLPRVPSWRINMLNTWHFTEKLNASLGIRYASDAFDTLNNSDTNSNVFGGTSDYFVVNLKTSHRFDNGLTLSAGIDNLFNEKYWMFHPFPQRTLIFDAVWNF